MKPHIIFSAAPVDSRKPDSLVSEQYEMARSRGISTSLVSMERWQDGRVELIPAPVPGARSIYRGWMVTPQEYRQLVDTAAKSGTAMLVDLNQYIAGHHLPQWYRLIREFTAETIIMSLDEASPERLRGLGWDGYFIKDYVKSLKTSGGSQITDPAGLTATLREMQTFRGTIEGGVCVRRIEAFRTGSEERYFVIDGSPCAANPGATIPKIVEIVSERIPSRFYSVDVGLREDGVLRVIEIGDGQVSDLVGWTAARFLEVLQFQENSATMLPRQIKLT